MQAIETSILFTTIINDAPYNPDVDTVRHLVYGHYEPAAYIVSREITAQHHDEDSDTAQIAQLRDYAVSIYLFRELYTNTVYID